MGWKRRAKVIMEHMRPVLTDERLDHLAEQFRLRRIRELTHATFGDYVQDPVWFDGMAGHLAGGGAVAWSETRPGYLFMVKGGSTRVAIPMVPRCMS